LMSDEERRAMNFKSVTTAGLLAASLLALAMPVAAQQQHLDVRTSAQKEQVTTNSAGETEVRLVPAATVVPGEKVVYTITFRNVSDEAAENVVITNPIAAELTFVNGSETSEGAVVEFSIDGGASFAGRDALTVVEDGARRPAEAKDFTHIRWVMQEELAAGAEGIVRFAAVLN
jgi:uncharacterized repeat protein (TIGR01451 family)